MIIINAIASILYVLIVVHQTLNQGFVGWMSNGTIFSHISSQGNGLTGVGLFAAALQTVLVYWVLNIFWRGAVLAHGLSKIFAIAVDDIAYMPHHSDRCCGLRSVGDAAIALNGILFLLGIYITLKLFDKTIVQDEPLTSDVGGLILVGGYLLIAPLLIQSTVGATHRFMKIARKSRLKPTEDLLNSKLAKLVSTENNSTEIADYGDYLTLSQTAKLLRRSIPVWPFHFRYFPGVSVIVPFISIVLSSLIVWAKSIVPFVRILDFLS